MRYISFLQSFTHKSVMSISAVHEAFITQEIWASRSRSTDRYRNYGTSPKRPLLRTVLWKPWERFESTWFIHSMDLLWISKDGHKYTRLKASFRVTISFLWMFPEIPQVSRLWKTDSTVQSFPDKNEGPSNWQDNFSVEDQIIRDFEVGERILNSCNMTRMKFTFGACFWCNQK